GTRSGGCGCGDQTGFTGGRAGSRNRILSGGVRTGRHSRLLSSEVGTAVGACPGWAIYIGVCRRVAVSATRSNRSRARLARKGLRSPRSHADAARHQPDLTPLTRQPPAGKAAPAVGAAGGSGNAVGGYFKSHPNPPHLSDV